MKVLQPKAVLPTLYAAGIYSVRPKTKMAEGSLAEKTKVSHNFAEGLSTIVQD